MKIMEVWKSGDVAKPFNVLTPTPAMSEATSEGAAINMPPRESIEAARAASSSKSR